MLAASLCTGGGLADIGMQQAGYELAWGIEIDPAIAETARHNLKHRVAAKSILDCNPNNFDKVDLLWASPPCPSFSVAKTNRGETDLDFALAVKIVDFLKTLQPRSFILENVQGYAKSRSLELIKSALVALGYMIDQRVVNAADHGVPQSRKRLILRAAKGGELLPLPPKQNHTGWYGAIKDIIDGMPETEFAPWQIARLPAALTRSCLLNRSQSERGDYFGEVKKPAYTVCAAGSAGRTRAFLVPGGNASSFSVRLDHEPSRTVSDVNRIGNLPRAFLANGTTNDSGRTTTVVDRSEPSFAITASQDKRPPRGWLENGRVIKITTQGQGRFQTLPDWYEGATCKIIGNGVPCRLAKVIARSFAA